jgi:FkbM family methyltransferase
MFRNKLQALRDNFYFDNGLFAALQRGPFRKENLVVYRKGPLTLLVDFAGGDASGTRSCLTSQMYSRFFALFDRTRPLAVLDLGANGGGFPLSLVLAGFTFSRLVCVEMNRHTCTRLRFNLDYNISGSVVTLNVAAAGRSGTIKIPATRGGTNESIDQASSSTSQELVEIPLITLDELIEGQFGPQPDTSIDICKMDIERAEYEIFQSGTCSAIRRVRHLIIEIHPHPDASASGLIDRICSFGFRHVSGAATDGGASVHLFTNETARP